VPVAPAPGAPSLPSVPVAPAPGVPSLPGVPVAPAPSAPSAPGPAAPGLPALPGAPAVPASLPSLPEGVPKLPATGALTGAIAPLTGAIAPVTNLTGTALNNVKNLAPQFNFLNQILGSILSKLLTLVKLPKGTPLGKRDSSVSTFPTLGELDLGRSIPNNAAHVVKAPAMFKRHENLVNAQALIRTRQMLAKADVAKFIQKWQQKGAAMTEATPATVNQMMEAFMNPTTASMSASALDQYPDSMKEFAMGLNNLAQYMEHMGATSEDKVDVLKAMFDDSAKVPSSKRSMRRGSRAQEVVQSEEHFYDALESMDDVGELVNKVFGGVPCIDPHADDSAVAGSF
jgi:hypothetical protein